MAAQFGENDMEIIHCICKSKGVHPKTGHAGPERGGGRALLFL